MSLFHAAPIAILLAGAAGALYLVTDAKDGQLWRITPR